MTMDLPPTILEGTHIRLVPMSMDHCDQLWEAGLDEELWRLTTVVIKGRDDMRRYIQEALKAQDKGMALPFVTVEKKTNKLVGSTRYGNIDESHRRVEIGWTWVAREWQRTVVNTEAKYLMLRHAFETMHCIRVEFKTDSLNEASRNALKRIGAKEEGVFRNHMITSGGRIRHSVYFSIIDSEWPDVKLQLERRLARGTGFAPNTGQT
jgi:RimJ/RimL family protein N-acetyltransferase